MPDGRYAGALPAMRYDGSARFTIVVMGPSKGPNCFRRELQLDRFVGVGLTVATIRDGIRFGNVAVSPFFSESLQTRLATEPPSGFERKSVVFTPRDRNGNPWGPGHAHQIALTLQNAEPFSELIDLINGDYEMVVQLPRGSRPTVVVAAAGITTPPLSLRPGSRLPLWLIALVLMLVILIALIRRMRRQTP